MKRILISGLTATAVLIMPTAALAGPIPRELPPCQVLNLTPAGTVAGPVVCS